MRALYTISRSNAYWLAGRSKPQSRRHPSSGPGARSHLHRLPPFIVRLRHPMSRGSPSCPRCRRVLRLVADRPGCSEAYFFFFAVEAALLFAGAFFVAALVFAFAAFFTMLPSWPN